MQCQWRRERTLLHQPGQRRGNTVDALVVHQPRTRVQSAVDGRLACRLQVDMHGAHALETLQAFDHHKRRPQTPKTQRQLNACVQLHAERHLHTLLLQSGPVHSEPVGMHVEHVERGGFQRGERLKEGGYERRQLRRDLVRRGDGHDGGEGGDGGVADAGAAALQALVDEQRQ